MNEINWWDLDEVTATQPPIDSFSGEYKFLSNFYPSPIIWEGKHYPTVEHAYQAMKCLDPQVQERVRNANTPNEAKRMGKVINRNGTLRSDWSEINMKLMENLLWQKFENPVLRKMLDATKPRELIEGNVWKDSFWGVYNGKGENHLGKLLMLIRSETFKKL